MQLHSRTSVLAIGLASFVAGTAASAADLSVVSGAVGRDIEELRKHLDMFEAETGISAAIVTMPASTTDQFGQYRLWLSAENPDIDIYRVDVIWAPQLANHFVDLAEHAKDVIDDHFPAIIQSQTVDDRLVALPMFTDAPALYYRADLLEKHGAAPPSTYVELTETAQAIQEAERAEGNSRIWGFVWQGAAYEGLTCNALEWVAANGGGGVVEDDGEISINNENAAEMLDLAATWPGNISPPGVLGYREEEARGVWQVGDAVFMRNWPYAYALGQSDDSAVKDLFGVVPLPTGPSGKQNAATLGGWNLAVSEYSRNKEQAIELVKYLSSYEIQKDRAIETTRLPTIPALYEDADVLGAQPVIGEWLPIFEEAVPRPSAPTKANYNQVSQEFWTAAHNTLSGNGDAATNLAQLERNLMRIRRADW